DVRAYAAPDRGWAGRLLAEGFGGPVQVVRGEAFDVLDLPGFVAEVDGEPAGLLTYRRYGEGWELAFVAALRRGVGVGSALVGALHEVAGGAPIRVVTTNDNLEALRFYQRQGFVLVELRPGAVDDARRRLKPSIPEVGDAGIPIRDELELELRTSGRDGGA
ncbi:MAG TPA: GNAT family N-acetyltransferase, partial [Actinomycetota bacterium]